MPVVLTPAPNFDNQKCLQTWARVPRGDHQVGTPEVETPLSFLTAASNSVLWVHHDLFNYFPTQQHSKSILNASEELKPQYIVILLYPSYKIGMIVFPVC